MQVIDTKAYRDQEVERRSFDVCDQHPEAIIYTDQSLTNVALKGKFAQLAPCWNWQWNFRLPLIAFRYPIFLRHFIGPMKPDRESSGLLEVRFNTAYREFLKNFMPELLPSLAPPCDPVPMEMKRVLRLTGRHIMARGLAVEAFRRHADPYKALY
jgi:hypothetical protein